MNQKEVKEIIELVASHQIAELEIERSGFKLRIKTVHSQPTAPVMPVVTAVHHEQSHPVSFVTPATAPPVHPATGNLTFEATPAPVAAPQPENLHKVTAPIVGTLYRAPNPNAKSFVEIGSRVQPGTVLCIIEAMKLMNEIEADVAGEIVEIHQENGKPVEYGQVLFTIRQD
ncbi:MAG: acetyl-CoA carboxylase biotin carboxyl carrier protein [Blastocatellia bacterium]|nr:acetyl-CoA carboxylase biotin carboxyl carrier protein [Blastocatellia bacterium]